MICCGVQVPGGQDCQIGHLNNFGLLLAPTSLKQRTVHNSAVDKLLVAAPTAQELKIALQVLGILVSTEKMLHSAFLVSSSSSLRMKTAISSSELSVRSHRFTSINSRCSAAASFYFGSDGTEFVPHPLLVHCFNLSVQAFFAHQHFVICCDSAQRRDPCPCTLYLYQFNEVTK